MVSLGKRGQSTGRDHTAIDVTVVRRALFASGLCGKSDSISAMRKKLHEWRGKERYILLRGERGVEFDLALGEMVEVPKHGRPLLPLIIDCRKIASSDSLSSLSAALQKPEYIGRPLMFLNGETLSVTRRIFLGRWLQTMEEEEKDEEQQRVICVTLSGVPVENNCYSLDEDLLHLCANRLLRLPPLRERVEDIPEMVKSIFAVMSGNDTLDQKSLSQELTGAFQNCSLEGNFDLILNAVGQSSAINGNSTFDVSRFKDLIIETGSNDNTVAFEQPEASAKSESESGLGLGLDDFLDAAIGTKEERKKTGQTNIPFEKYILNLPKS